MEYPPTNTMRTTKQINPTGTMSNLVGLWAIIPAASSEASLSAQVVGKADDEYFLVQFISALGGQPNLIKMYTLKEMVCWRFYNDADVLLDDRQHFLEQKRFRYIANPITNPPHTKSINTK